MTAKKTRDLSTFAHAYDPKVAIPKKIRDSLAKLAKDHGPQAYAYEFKNPSDDNLIDPLTVLSTVGQTILVGYRSQFKDHIVFTSGVSGREKDKRVVWFATTAAATRARGGKAE